MGAETFLALRGIDVSPSLDMKAEYTPNIVRRAATRFDCLEVVILIVEVQYRGCTTM